MYQLVNVNHILNCRGSMLHFEKVLKTINKSLEESEAMKKRFEVAIKDEKFGGVTIDIIKRVEELYGLITTWLAIQT